MIFKLHYWFVASGINAVGILMGVFIETYTDASSTEIGLLYMLMPVTGLIFRPVICSIADREQAHRFYLMLCLAISAVSYTPFIIIPLMGPQVYEVHPRFCWYFLVTLKVIGDIAFGGVFSIGDSLAINYAKRIGTDFSVYRVWGTISWMVFGIITGQINEVSFLPKYVPGFLVLISASLMNMLVIYLWPPEYFVMVPHNEKRIQQLKQELANEESKFGAMTKSLMPREMVWAHAKQKLRLLLTCSCFSAPKLADKKQQAADLDVVKTAPTNQANLENGNSQLETSNQDNVVATTKQPPTKETRISKKTQVQILLLLLKRDVRIIPYLLLFVCAGSVVVPLSFFFMSLSAICHEHNRCDFSQLGGFLQVSMAIAETILFLYIKRIIATIGRLNTVAVSFFLTSLKYTFYATIWPSVDPHFALLSELPHGIIFGIFLTLMVELGHLFANEVEYILPELIERQIISKDDDLDRLKMSLAATMQAVVSSANDGIGRGVGALIYGLILDHYSYHTLWLVIGIGAAVVFLIIEAVNILDHIFQFQLGLDVAAKKADKPEKLESIVGETNTSEQVAV